MSLINELNDFIKPKLPRGRSLTEEEYAEDIFGKIPAFIKLDEGNIAEQLPLPEKPAYDSFATSYLYLLATGRRGIWLCKDQQSGASCIVMWHPNVQDQLLLLPDEKSDYIAILLAKTLSWPAKGIQIMRSAPTREGVYGQHSAFIKTREPILDWKFPAHVLDVDYVSDPFSKDWQKTRQNIGRYYALAKPRNDLETDPAIDTRGINFVTNNDEQKFGAMTRLWMMQRGYMGYTSFIGATAETFTAKAFRLAKETALAQCKGVELNGELVGYVLWDENPRNRVANYHGMVYDNGTTPGKPGESDNKVKRQFLSDIILFKLCRHLQIRDMKYLNLGGSEDENLDHWKRKFLPGRSYKLDTYLIDNNRLATIELKPPDGPALG